MERAPATASAARTRQPDTLFFEFSLSPSSNATRLHTIGPNTDSVCLLPNKELPSPASRPGLAKHDGYGCYHLPGNPKQVPSPSLPPSQAPLLLSLAPPFAILLPSPFLPSRHHFSSLRFLLLFLAVVRIFNLIPVSRYLFGLQGSGKTTLVNRLECGKFNYVLPSRSVQSIKMDVASGGVPFEAIDSSGSMEYGLLLLLVLLLLLLLLSAVGTLVRAQCPGWKRALRGGYEAAHGGRRGMYPPCISYALVQATVGVGTVVIVYVI